METALERVLESARCALVGRAAELAALDAAIAAGARLITVVGPPGAGKSRLAAEAASRHAASTSGAPALLVELQEADSAEAVLALLGKALATPLPGGAGARDDVGAITAVLAARGPGLIVLDELEHVLPVMRPLLTRWLADAPDTTFLTTSRERTGLPGERAIDLGPLALPGPGSGEDPLASAAAQLFVARAAAEHPHFRVSAADGALVAAIVTALDGLPLAIELCAARAPMLSLQQLHDNLGHRFELLTEVAATARAPRSLRAAIAWSWHLLRPYEQRALAQCAVFRGGFSLEAASAVVDLAAHPEAPWTLDILQELRSKSLIFSSSAATGETRHALYDCIRDYAAAALEQQGDRAQTEQRHAAYFVAAAELRARAIDGAGALRAQRWLALEHDNLLAVHQRARAAAPPAHEHALRVALALGALLARRGPATQQVALLDQSLAGADARAEALVTAALEMRGNARRILGDMAGSAADLARGADLARSLGDDRLLGRLLSAQGTHAAARGNLVEARACFAAARPLHQRAGDAQGEGSTVGTLGHLAMSQGALDEARADYLEAVALFRRAGDRRGEAISLSGLAALEHGLGHLDEAQLFFQQALAMLAEVGERRYAAVSSGHLGLVELERGRLDEGRRLLERSLQDNRAFGNRRVEGLFLAYLGACLREQGQRDGARVALATALRLADEVGNVPAQVLALCEQAQLDLDSDQLAIAEQRVADARTRAESVSDEVGLAVVALTEGCLAVARASTSTALIDFARTRASDDHLLLLSATSYDVRHARTLLTRALDRIATPALRLERHGRWFALPNQQPVSLLRRTALQLVLARLIAERDRAPWHALEVDTLLEAGWPGQRLRADSGASRVYVAVSVLRGMGLGDLLVRAGSGYLLDPKLSIDIIDDAAADPS